MARRGAAGVGDDRPDRPEPPSRTGRGRETRDWQPERWIQEPARPTARKAAGRKPARPEPARFEPPSVQGRRRRARVPGEVTSELQSAAGARRAPRLAERLGEASRAYERDRYDEARRILKPLAEEAPASAAVRELYGLTLYRMGRWREALRQLAAFHELSGSYDQFPTMEDCERALGRHAEVERLWRELGEASPGAELMTEGRIVLAGSLADRGDLAGAIRLLEPTARRITRPREHHLRLWYTLADLYERSGELPAARDLFGRIVRNDASFFDTAERVAALA